jgi:hypothetical protein
MIISNIELIKENGTIRAEAQITWENAERAPFTLFVQTLAQYEDYFFADPNSFVIASLMPAYHYAEPRIRVEGALSPLLIHNLQGVFMLMKAWYPNDFQQPPVFEADRLEARAPFTTGAISLLSGGIDSLALLRTNRLNYPTTHPTWIKAVLCVEFVRNHAPNESELLKPLQGRLNSMKPVIEETGVTAIPVISNTWWLNPDGYFYGQKSYGAQLFAQSTFFSKGFHTGIIASSYDAAFLHKPWGSHPQLDAYYSSSHFAIQHIGTEMTRLKKVSIVADWPTGLHHLRVCQNDNSGASNCGTCEKCLRTKLMLEALGKLRGCKAFPDDTLDSERLYYLDTYKMLHSTDKVHDEEKLYLYSQAIPLLKERKRLDLVDTLEDVLHKLQEKRQATLV